MNSFILKFYHGTLLGNGLRFIFHSLINSLPDKQFQKYRYFKNMGKKLRLNPPKTLNEKICWLKLNDRTPLHTQCADKYGVRDYVIEKIGSEYLVPLYFQTENVEDISDEKLTLTPCIIKTNHDSGGGIFIYEKQNINWVEVRSELKERLLHNYYDKYREWQYKNIKPSIIVEKLLINKEGAIPFDYKLHCFNGKVRMIQVDMGRGTKKHYRNWYDINWNREPYKWSSPKQNGEQTDPSKEDIAKPDTFDEMVLLSNKLSEPFDYARVDWYDVDSTLYFGEITFHHDGGTKPILPEAWDLKLGQELELTKYKN